jgi:hypothetical protein
MITPSVPVLRMYWISHGLRALADAKAFASLGRAGLDALGLSSLYAANSAQGRGPQARGPASGWAG